MSWKDDGVQERIKNWAITMLIVACLIAAVAVILVGVGSLVWDAYLQRVNTELCYKNGYTEYRTGYCYRLVDGTEELVSIGNLK